MSKQPTRNIPTINKSEQATNKEKIDREKLTPKKQSELVDQDSKDSFPASDAPANY
jgi:hypothetical protein